MMQCTALFSVVLQKAELEESGESKSRKRIMKRGVERRKM